MIGEDYFWKATVSELKQGYYMNKETNSYTCLICGESYEEGMIYPAGENFCTAKKAMEYHLVDQHKSMFDYFLEMGKAYTGLTENQKELIRLFYEGYSDKEIVEKTGATSTSTIRNQRFSMNEKYKQAKIIVAMTELLEEKKIENKQSRKKETLIDIHRTATSIDERYAITQAERDEVIKRYFDDDNNLIVKAFPAKEKKKIIILQHIMKEFTPNRCYKETEVNEIIMKFYNDFVTVRRYFIQYGFLDRKKDGAEYWVKQV